jgi:hypothetical protein
LSLNKWLLRAAKQKFEVERLLREQERKESGGEEEKEEVLKFDSVQDGDWVGVPPRWRLK